MTAASSRTLQYSTPARADLEQIIQFGIREQLPNSGKFVRSIQSRIAVLATHSESGRAGRVIGTREWVLTGTPYIVVHRISGNAIQVLRVLHGAQIQ